MFVQAGGLERLCPSIWEMICHLDFTIVWSSFLWFSSILLDHLILTDSYNILPPIQYFKPDKYGSAFTSLEYVFFCLLLENKSETLSGPSCIT